MNILLLGSGGREHALAWKIAASPLTDKLYCAPGNAGIAKECELAPLDIADHAAVVAFCRVRSIDFVVVGPEAPLCAGIVDDLAAAGIKAFGPSKAAAQLEGSKGFTKDICKANNIPTAAYERHESAESAIAYVKSMGGPLVVKADGLAAGKGVVVPDSIGATITAIGDIYRDDPRAKSVLEEILIGEEASFFALCDGETAIPLVAAQDHKRVFDGDLGPNTGGMGAYSPAPVMTRGDDPPHHGRDRAADGAGDESDGRALQGRPFCRADDHRQRAEADRIQRALRRPGVPGADAAADVGPGARRCWRRATAC